MHGETYADAPNQGLLNKPFWQHSHKRRPVFLQNFRPMEQPSFGIQNKKADEQNTHLYRDEIFSYSSQSAALSFSSKGQSAFWSLFREG